MKTFALITVGFKQPTAEMMQAWKQWFTQLKPYLKEQFGFSKGHRIAEGKTEELPFDLNAITGCIVIAVENESKALALAKKCPAVTETRVYEIRNQDPSL